MTAPTEPSEIVRARAGAMLQKPPDGSGCGGSNRGRVPDHALLHELAGPRAAASDRRPHVVAAHGEFAERVVDRMARRKSVDHPALCVKRCGYQSCERLADHACWQPKRTGFTSCAVGPTWPNRSRQHSGRSCKIIPQLPREREECRCRPLRCRTTRQQCLRGLRCRSCRDP